MELYEVIEKRRTIFVYKQPASKEQLRRITLAGSKAPSAMNSQPWEFIIVEDQDLKDQIAEIKFQTVQNGPLKKKAPPEVVKEKALAQKNSFQNASVLAVCHKLNEASSSWCAIENMSLAAVAEGLGSGIVDYPEEGKKKIEGILGIPEDYELTAVLKIGEIGKEPFPRDQNPFGPVRPEFSWFHTNAF
jgi:5,6-dimethylbenzimidazole synthase